LCFKLILLLNRGGWLLIDIIFEDALLKSAIWETHSAKTMLDAVLPLTLVAAAIGPVHLAIAVPLILLVAAAVLVTRLPRKCANARLLIIHVVAFVLIAVGLGGSLFPFSLAVLHSAFELTHVQTRILPLVLAEAMWLAILVLASVHITISKLIRPLSMLQTELPFPFVSIAIFPLVNSVAISFTLRPLAYV